MKNKINQLFDSGKKNILSVYFTAGFPQIEDTVEILKLLEQNGVDLVEIGIPFSDPTADGLTIQKSSEKALKNGMSLKILFSQLEHVRKSVQIPLVLMGYFNPVMQYGVDEFCRQCSIAGIDGVILPDLPLEEFQEHYEPDFLKYNLHNILLITPQTPDKRIRLIDEASKGFIYMVSTTSTTGEGKKVEDFRIEYFERVNNLNLKNPRLIGFGISDQATFENACMYAHGAIIGSAFVKSLQMGMELNESIPQFIRKIKNFE